MEREPDAWLIKTINEQDPRKRLAAVALSIGMAWDDEYQRKVHNAVMDAGHEIDRLRTELAAKNRLLNDYARMKG